jgi:hypothetical protein
MTTPADAAQPGAADNGDLGVLQFSRDIRQRASRGREQTVEILLAVATKRDEMSDARDLAAARRDEIADTWDRTMAALDVTFEECFAPVGVTAGEIVMRAGELRKCARKYCEQAAAHRALAAADRRAAAEDRLQAAHARLLAAADREAFVREFANVSLTD